MKNSGGEERKVFTWKWTFSKETILFSKMFNLEPTIWIDTLKVELVKELFHKLYLTIIFFLKGIFLISIKSKWQEMYI